MVVRHALLLLCLVLGVGPAAAVVVDGRSPERAERPPRDDPGWQHVVRRGGTSAIYLGDGWVLTARHAGMGEVKLDEQVYPAVPDSMFWLDTPGAQGVKADLILFRVDPAPALPRLAISRERPEMGAKLILVGYGGGIGEPTEWNGRPGFQRARNGFKRWGTNLAEPGLGIVPGPQGTLTRCFEMTFSSRGTPHEAQAAVGDSGGAVFAQGAEGWELAGVMVAVGTMPGQPRPLTLYGNSTSAADLSLYRPQILRVMAGQEPRPAPPPPTAD